MKETDQFYLKLAEPNGSCLQALREIIMGFDPQISEVWKYQTPFFCYQQKNLCYFGIHRKTQQPYIGLVEGRYLDHPALESGHRSRIKILNIDPHADIPLETLNDIFRQAILLY
ncbi:MAG: DUF1801 domain-containing protein [Cyclobacteriaceae bacterium]